MKFTYTRLWNGLKIIFLIVMTYTFITNVMKSDEQLTLLMNFLFLLFVIIGIDLILKSINFFVGKLDNRKLTCKICNKKYLDCSGKVTINSDFYCLDCYKEYYDEIIKIYSEEENIFDRQI